LDRFDLVVPLFRPDASKLLYGEPGESSVAVARRVVRARNRASARRAMGRDEIALSAAAKSTLEERLRSGELSARGMRKVARVAQTLADLFADTDDSVVSEEHLAEALSLRSGCRILAQ
jgi:magnesium chelatase family protein